VIKLKRKFKAGQLLEFTLLMPMVVLLMTFSVDMGRLVVASTSLRDAAGISARAGARVGYAGFVPTPSNCSNDSNSASVSYHAFCQDATMLMGAKVTSFQVLTPNYGSDYYCIYNNGLNDTTNMYITVKATARMDFLTPGLASALKLSNGTIDSYSDISASGAARCEVSR
jgi:hypothetical protein